MQDTFYSVRMSYCVKELEALMKEAGIKSGAGLARMSGVVESTISRARTGSGSFSVDDLGKIAAAIGKSPVIHARLLRGWLQDNCPEPGGELLTIEINGKRGSEAPKEMPDFGSNLTPKFQKHMAAIARAIPTDKNIRGVIEALGNLAQKGSIS